ncbi:MAG: nickel-dependent lactate racemase [bacterium]|jgi:nickel-dependent lactate racemase
MPDYKLKYGDREETISVPIGIECREFAPRACPPLDNVENALRRALRNPIGAAPLMEAARGKKNLVVIVSDHTRKCRYDATLPVLFDELTRVAKIPAQAITILVATGTHRFMTDAELAAHLGTEIVKKYKIVQHDGSDSGKMKRCGKTTRGTIIYYNPVAFEADFIILTGSITYHYFAGFTGGRKALFPGVAARESIIQNHSLCIDPETGFFHDRVRPGSLLGNPVHEDMLDAAGELRPDFLMDVVLTPSGGIAGVFAGDFSYAHRVGCQFVEDFYGIVVGGRENPYADIAIASAGGYPRDINFYQTHKSLVNGTNLLNPDGGQLVLLAECREGLGHPVFEDWKEFKTADTVRLRLQNKYSPLGHLILSLRTRAEKHKIYLVSSLPDEEVRSLGLIPAKTAGQAMGMIFSKVRPPFPPITIMPYASLATPIRPSDRVGITAKEMTKYYDEFDKSAEEPDEIEIDDGDSNTSELARKIFGG